MAKVLFVHGMRMQKKAPDPLQEDWSGRLRALLERTAWGRDAPAAVDGWSRPDLAYWADLFDWRDRSPFDDPAKGLDLSAIRKAFYLVPRGGLLATDALASHSDQEGRPTSPVALFCDGLVQQTAVYMHNGPTFGTSAAVVDANPAVMGRGDVAFTWDARDGRGAYFEVQQRVEDALKDDTRIVIAHSLGTVIAYEALCRLKHRVHTFITIGSPMATPELILAPLKQRFGWSLRRDPSLPFPWPNVTNWVNFYAPADVWCVPVPHLAKAIDPRIHDVAVDHGTVFKPSDTHLLKAYLAHDEIGDAVADAIVAVGREEVARPAASTVLAPDDAGKPGAGPTGRRFFAAIGVSAPREMKPLPEVVRDVERMRGVFEKGLAYERITVPREPTANDLRDALTDWPDGDRPGPQDSLVLYYSGHGQVAGDVHYLCTRDFDESATGRAFRSRELAELVLRQRPAPGKLWIILDCCQAGDALRELNDELQKWPGAHYALASTGPHSPSFDGAFSKAFVAAVGGAPGEIVSQNALALSLDALLRAGRRAPVRKLDPQVASPFDFLTGLRRGQIPEVRVPRRRRLAPWGVPAALIVAAIIGSASWGLHHGAAAPQPGEQPTSGPAERAASLATIAVPAGLAVLGTDEATARRMYGECVGASGAACGADYSLSAFARQVGWSGSTPARVNAFELGAREVTRGEFASWLNGKRGEMVVERDGAGLRLRDSQGHLLATAGGETARGAPIGSSGGRFQPAPGTDDDPVTLVSWYGATAYCADRHGRLPTEQEWEFAARGPEGRAFPWGDDPPGTGVAYAAAPCGAGERGAGECAAAAVGTSPADRTREGVFDLAGNVGEWTASSFAGLTPAERTHCEAAACRIVRGGSYREGAVWLHAAIRSRFAAEEVLENVGFRCAGHVGP
jgi:serine/threonine-protein kinase